MSMAFSMQSAGEEQDSVGSLEMYINEKQVASLGVYYDPDFDCLDRQVDLCFYRVGVQGNVGSENKLDALLSEIAVWDRARSIVYEVDMLFR